MSSNNTLVAHDSRLFMAQVLSHAADNAQLSTDRFRKIEKELFEISDKLIVRKVENFSSSTALSLQAERAKILSSLGLQYASKGLIELAITLLRRNRVIKFFQIGNTLLHKLTERAEAAIENLVLKLNGEQLEVFNSYEYQFLISLTHRKLQIDRAEILLGELGSIREFTTLGQVEMANGQLDFFDFRLKYLRSFPIDKIQSVDLSASDDPAYDLTISLIVNLTIYGTASFELDNEDLDNFRNIAIDPKTGNVQKPMQELAMTWLQRHAEFSELSENVVNYAKEYWRYCLEQLCL